MPKKEYFLKQRAIIDPDGNRAGSASNLHSALRSYVIKVNRKRNREGLPPTTMNDFQVEETTHEGQPAFRITKPKRTTITVS